MKTGKRSNFYYLAFIICIASLGFLVANVQGTDLGGSGSVIEAFVQLQKVLLPLSLGLWAVILAYFIFRSFGGRKGKALSQGEEPKFSIVGIVAFLVILSAISFLTGSAPKMMEPDPGSSVVDPSVSDGPGNPPADISSSFSAILLVALFALILIPIVRFKRGKDAFGTISKNEKFEESVMVHEAIGELRRTSDDDLKDVVLNTYRQMLRLVQKRMGGTDPLTPRELADVTIIRFGWPEKDVRGLTEIFEVARYGVRNLKEEEKVQAIGYLAGIEQSIGTRREIDA
jgi:hypothetical protein